MFIFTKPWTEEDETNIVEEEVRPLAKQVYQDQTIQSAVEHLRTLFLEKKECLVQGDLHTGSVMIKDGDAKVRMSLVIVKGIS